MQAAVANNKPSLSERINFRMIAVTAVVLFLVGYPVYQYVSASLNKGIAKHGDIYNVDLKSLGNFPFDDTNGTVNDINSVFGQVNGVFNDVDDTLGLLLQILEKDPQGNRHVIRAIVQQLIGDVLGAPADLKAKVMAVMPPRN